MYCIRSRECGQWVTFENDPRRNARLPICVASHLGGGCTATETQLRNRDKKCALSRESEGWVNFEPSGNHRVPHRNLCHITSQCGYCVNNQFAKTRRSQAVRRIVMIVKLSDFRQREAKLRLYLRAETRLRKTNKEVYPIPWMRGLSKFLTVGPTGYVRVLHRNLVMLSHLITGTD